MTDPNPSPAAAVRDVVKLYFAGAKGERGVLQRAFYSSCNLHSLDADGKLELVPLERFIEFAEAGLLPAHESRILDVDVIGELARATVEFVFPTFRFVDVLTLLPVRGEWRIVSKVYTKQPI